MSGIYKGIYKGNDKFVKVIKNGEIIWSLAEGKTLTFKTKRMTSPYSDRIYAPSSVIKELSNKVIISIKIGDFKELNNNPISRLSSENLMFRSNLDVLLGATDWIDIGTEIKVEYL